MTKSGLGLAAIALTLAGCSGDLVPVTGSVTFQGQPLASGTVAFHRAGGGSTGYGNILAGRYEAKTGNRIGLKPGEYRVTVRAHAAPPPEQHNTWPVAPPLLTPDDYAQPETTPLQCIVPAASDTFDIVVEDS